MVSERVRQTLSSAGFTMSDEGIARAAAELDDLYANVTPELQRQAAVLKTRISRGRSQ
jgi:hypothetical protein